MTDLGVSPALVDAYADALARASARHRDLGRFRVFSGDTSGGPVPARPRPDAGPAYSPADIAGLLTAMSETGFTPWLEWVGETHPSLTAAAAALAGVGRWEVEPVFALAPGAEPATVAGPRGGTVSLLDADDARLEAVLAAMAGGFTESAEPLEFPVGNRAERLSAGRLLVAGAFADDGEVVGGAQAVPIDGVAELTGMAVLPKARRRGFGTALMAARIEALRGRGVGSVLVRATSPGARAAARTLGLRPVATEQSLRPPPGEQPAMSDEAVLVRLTPDDWSQARQIRLRALAHDPDSFGATLLDNACYEEAQWRERLAGEGPTYAVRAGGRLLAMGGGFVPDSEGAVVWGMWTAPEARRRGHGRRILAALVDWATERGRTPSLHVAEGNDDARALYLAAGFVPTGEWSPLRPGSPVRIEELRFAAGS